MAYGLTGITAVESWTAASEYADDIALDVDVTSCMTNGTTGEDCDEWKEGTLNCRVEIGYGPASILTLSVRFYMNSFMTAGDNELLPYTDANSVSSTNAVNLTYGTAGQWYEHDCSAAFIAELGDLGGYCAVRLASPDISKPKLGEVQIDITIYTLTLAGITQDYDKSALVSCEYSVFVRNGMAPETWVLSTSGTSNGSTGAYTEELGIGTYRVVAVKDVEPQVMNFGPPIIGAQATAADEVFALGLYHGLVNDDQVYAYQCGVASLPGAISEDTLYYIVQLSGDTCKLSLSQGGSAINITSDGDCWLVGEPATS